MSDTSASPARDAEAVRIARLARRMERGMVSELVGALRVHRLKHCVTQDALRPSSDRRCVAVTVSAVRRRRR